MSGGCAVNHASNCFRDIIPTHYSPHAFAQQMANMLKVDMSEADKVPKAEMTEICETFGTLICS